MKRFDFASEVTKQLITISSAIITVVIAFYEKFLGHGTVVFLLTVFLLLLFVFSICAGILSIGALTSLVERQEHIEAGPKPKRKTKAAVSKRFVKLGGSNAPRCAIWQQILFVLGLMGFICLAIADRVFLQSQKPIASQVSAMPTTQ